MEETPHEVLFYRIAKTESDSGEIVQNFYIPNPSEEEKFKKRLIKFFDSQVKYGEQYNYEVFAYPLVLGKKYQYKPIFNEERFKEDISLEYHTIFKFFEYAFRTESIIKEIDSINVTFDSKEQRYTRQLSLFLELVDTFVNLELEGAYGNNYIGFLEKMRSKLRSFFKTVYEFIADSVQSPIEGIPAFQQVEGVRILTYLLETWEYSAKNFADKYPNKKLPSADLDPNRTFPIDEMWKTIYEIIVTVADLRDPPVRGLSYVLEHITANGYRGIRVGAALDVYLDYMTSKMYLLFFNKQDLQNQSDLITRGSVQDFKRTEFDKFELRLYDYAPLMEIPIFSVSGRCLDAPPVAPQVSFLALKDTNNKVLIKLKSQNTQYYAEPTIINDSDREIFDQLANSRGTDKQGRLLFKTDDYLSKFEIYRLDFKPESYSDFGTNIRKQVDLQGLYSSSEYFDKIVANKKYYYTFRAIDEHGHLSDPTPVYEFILHDDGGFLFPELNIVDFDQKDYFDFTSNMQRYIQIKPAAQNVILNPELITDKQSAYDLECEKKNSSPPPLGIASDGAWGKKFKLRVTSKISGKKVDINFTFNKEHKKTKKENK